MAINGIDPAAKAPSRIRRNWARTTKGAVASTFVTIQPITIDSQDRFALNVASNGGIDNSVGALKLKLDTNPGLVISSSGLKLKLDTNPGLVLGAGGVKVLLDTNPGLALGSGGLSVFLNLSNGCLTTVSGLAVLVNAAGALNRTGTGLQVAVDGSTIEIAANALQVKDGGITGAKLASGLTLPSFKVSEAANGRMGTVTLAAGTATVSNTSVTANTRIFLSMVSPNGGTPGFLDTATRNPGTDFTITSTSVADTSIVTYLLIEPG